MKLYGLGFDMLEISRMQKKMENPAFFSRVFSENEQQLILQKGKNAAQTAAANFCGKEAFAKAVGTGFKHMKLQDIEILRNNDGKPYVQLCGKLKEIYGHICFEISLTHTAQTAGAVVCAVTED